VSDRIARASGIAANVGNLLMSSFRTGVGTERKSRGVLTSLDREAESLIVSELHSAFPSDGIVSEEGTGIEGDSDWRWLVDPLDGTTNYVAGLPFFAVSLACMQEETVVAGVVHAPAMRETFTVTPDGAEGPDGRMEVSQTSGLSDAVMLLNKAYHPAPALWGVAGDLLEHLRAFRMFGCVSLELAYVAAGRVDGILLLPAEVWDLAAAVAMLNASGADVVNLWGRTPKATERSGIVAASPKLLDQILPFVHEERMAHGA
jgi:myo-inositol-1(or 4)-monophosphatase